MMMQCVKSILVALMATLLLIGNGAYVAYGATTEAKTTSPLDIELTKEWDQLLSEVWVGISTGRMPPLPEPVILGENDEDVIDGDVDPLEMEAAADEEYHRRSQAFIKEANKKSSMDGDEFLGKDERCKALWEIIEKHVEKEKVNSSFVELGAGNTLYVPAREDPLTKHSGDSSGQPSGRAWVQSHTKEKHAKDEVQPITIRGCLSLRAAMALKRATVVYTGHVHYPTVAGEEEDETSNILIKADRTVQLRNKLQNRPQNHIVCNAPVSSETIGMLVDRTPELYTYLVLTELRSLAGTMLPHEFERFLGQILSLSTRTFLPTPLPDDHYFSYWKNAHDLATAAAHSVDLDVQIETLKKQESTSFNWYNRQSNNADKDKHGQPKLDGAIMVQLSEYKSVPLKQKVTSKDEGGNGKKGEKDEHKGAGQSKNDNNKKDGKAKEDKKKDGETKKSRRRRLHANWYVNHFNNRFDHKDKHKDKNMEKVADGKTNTEMKMVPTFLNTSDSGISLKTLRILEISEFDRARIFLNLLKTADASIMKANKPGEIKFVRGALTFSQGSLGKTNVKLGVDSAEREEHPRVRNEGAEVKLNDADKIAESEPAPSSEKEKSAMYNQGPKEKSGFTDIATKTSSKKYITESESFATPIKGIRIVKKNTIKRKQESHDTKSVSHTGKKGARSNFRKPTTSSNKIKIMKDGAKSSSELETKAKERLKTLLRSALLHNAKEQDVNDAGDDNDESDDALERSSGETSKRRRRMLSQSKHGKRSLASPAEILKRWMRRPSLHHRQRDWASKKLKGQLNMVVHENDGFERWWPLFRSDEIESSKGKHRNSVTWSIVVHGENLGLLSTKLAIMYPKSTIVSVKDDTTDTDSHLHLLELLGIHNNLLCNQRLKSISGEDQAESSKIIARYGILGMDVFQKIMEYVNRLDQFEQMLGSLISVAATTFMELPNWDALTAAIDTITGNEDAENSVSKTFTTRYLDIASSRGSADPWVGLLSAAANKAGLSGVTMRMLSISKNRRSSASNSVLERVKFSIYRRLAKRNIRSHNGKGDGRGFRKKLHRSGKVNLVRIDVQPWAKKGEATIQRFKHGGVSLAALKKFGIIPKQLAQLLRIFLRLPFQQIEKTEGSSAVIAPWNTFYHGSGGGYRSAFPRIVVSFEKSGASYQAYHVPENEEAEEDASKLVDPRWEVVKKALTKEDVGEEGEFSYLEFNSGSGLLSLSVAEQFPSATVVSVESEKVNVAAHLKRIKILGQSQVNDAGKKKKKRKTKDQDDQQLAKVAANNWVCNVDVGLDILRKLYESPEFIRWQVFGGNLVLDHMYDSGGPASMKEALGYVMSTGMTTFLTIPSAKALSLGLYLFYHSPIDIGSSRRDEDSVDFAISSHPRPRYMQAEMQIISSMAKVPGSTKLSMQSLPGNTINMVRVDVINMTRNVNHHFDYARDGHQRKYKMHVERNISKVLYRSGITKRDESDSNSMQIVHSNMQEGQHSNRGMVINVYITRQHDKWHIPYGQLYGITLITILRMGLVESQRTAAYHRFVNLPLYEDMAPWNIVFQGSRMAYIDYDTKDVTYDRVVPLTYRVLSVLFNYKRTVEDFKRCGPSSHNSYGFPHINSCVGGKVKTDFVRNGGKKCEESNAPVPCGDGSCQSDYIKCLKVLSSLERNKRKRASPKVTKSSLMDMWRSKEWTFSNKGIVKTNLRG